MCVVLGYGTAPVTKNINIFIMENFGKIQNLDMADSGMFMLYAFFMQNAVFFLLTDFVNNTICDHLAHYCTSYFLNKFFYLK